MKRDLNWVMNTQYNIRMIYYIELYPRNLYNSINQCHPNKFFKKSVPQLGRAHEDLVTPRLLE